MKNIIVLLTMLMLKCTFIQPPAKPNNPFFNDIKDKIYHTWAYDGNLVYSDIYTVENGGERILYQNTYNYLSYTYTHIQTLSSNQAIYIQESSAIPVYVALITTNDGRDVFKAFNPNMENTNQIDWDTKINFLKAI